MNISHTNTHRHASNHHHTNMKHLMTNIHFHTQMWWEDVEEWWAGKVTSHRSDVTRVTDTNTRQSCLSFTLTFFPHFSNSIEMWNLQTPRAAGETWGESIWFTSHRTETYPQCTAAPEHCNQAVKSLSSNHSVCVCVCVSFWLEEYAHTYTHTHIRFIFSSIIWRAAHDHTLTALHSSSDSWKTPRIPLELEICSSKRITDGVEVDLWPTYEDEHTEQTHLWLHLYFYCFYFMFRVFLFYLLFSV